MTAPPGRRTHGARRSRNSRTSRDRDDAHEPPEGSGIPDHRDTRATRERGETMSVRTRKLLTVVARICWTVFAALLAADLTIGLPGSPLLVTVPGAVAAVLNLVEVAAARRARVAVTPESRPPEAVEVEPPVRGRWTAYNSPADRTPSHGTHMLAQTYAIDLIGESGTGSAVARPEFAVFWPPARPSAEYPGFGAPVLAVADATVVHAVDRRRDHLSRTSWPMIAYLFLVEGIVRSLGGPDRIAGNHVVLDLGDGTYAMYAHLQRGSVTVRPGDRVRAGRQLGRCGNSGNSTEPHLHFQLMDGPDMSVASGIPFRFTGLGVPANGETFTARSPAFDAVQASAAEAEARELLPGAPSGAIPEGPSGTDR
jgi:hypothetical protein